ncbi:hypothetical protein QEK82_001248 [Stenotrophomonas maltophilia]|uniref:hypothetical protein n=1 Tax=Stenotrophomonas maltophilia group sp. Smal13 TaxID=3377166 RepID=UPI001311085C|nr:hypothetical protein [Stenotrophomonas maltophilia]EKU9957551.1 hypothetical protein [Stenotrophomonas maltophilia]EKU9984458.1 hypothetical protein [Stenotrophomonas maltophilia]
MDVLVIDSFEATLRSSITCMPGPGCTIEWDTVAAIASFFVGFLAWITARRSSKIAERAVGIAAQQHRELEIQRVKAGEVLGHMLVVEIGALPAVLAETRNLICRLKETGKTSATCDAVTLDGNLTRKLRIRFATDAMASTALSVSRIHNLPDEVAHKLARLLGSYRLLQLSALQLLEHCDDETYDNVPYERGLEDWTTLEGVVRFVFDAAVDSAIATRLFVKAPSASYDSDGRAILSKGEAAHSSNNSHEMPTSAPLGSTS